jgi:hypothetical protein
VPVAPAINIRGLAAACVMFLPAGCSGGQSFEIGAHRGKVKAPTGWSVVTRDEKWKVRTGKVSIVLHDLGPVSPAASLREASRIIALWQGGNAADAQVQLGRIHANVSRFIEAPHRRPLVDTMVPLLVLGAPGMPAEDAARHFSRWQRALSAVPPPTIEAIGDAALSVAGHDQRRAIQSRQRRIVGGKPAMDYLTVTRGTQSARQRIVVIDNDGHVLLVYAGGHGHEAYLGEFDRLVRSLRIGKRDGSSSADSRSPHRRPSDAATSPGAGNRPVARFEYTTWPSASTSNTPPLDLTSDALAPKALSSSAARLAARAS